MGKKAFTLVELIAVIVILSLIALVVFPAISSVIKNSKEKAYKDQIAQIEKAAKQYCYEHTEKLPNETEGSKATLDIAVLKTEGYISEDQIKDPRNTKKEITGSVIITYTSNQYDYQFSDAKVANTLGKTIMDKANSTDKALLKSNDGVYKGTTSNNYVNFSGSVWRIIKINKDNSIKIVKDAAPTKLQWNTSGAVFTNSTVSNYLNKTYYTSLSGKSLIKSSSWCTGPLDNECSQTVQGYVGLLATSDYKNASSDLNCKTNAATCKNGNFLATYSVSSGAEYTLNTNGSAIYTVSSGVIGSSAPTASLNIRPVVVINSNAKITGGSGTSGSPYVLSN